MSKPCTCDQIEVPGTVYVDVKIDPSCPIHGSQKVETGYIQHQLQGMPELIAAVKELTATVEKLVPCACVWNIGATKEECSVDRDNCLKHGGKK